MISLLSEPTMSVFFCRDLGENSSATVMFFHDLGGPLIILTPSESVSLSVSFEGAAGAKFIREIFLASTKCCRNDCKLSLLHLAQRKCCCQTGRIQTGTRG